MQIRSNVVGSVSRWLGFKVCFREEMQEAGQWNGNYFAAADKATAELSQQEEDDCIRMGIQVSGYSSSVCLMSANGRAGYLLSSLVSPAVQE